MSDAITTIERQHVDIIASLSAALAGKKKRYPQHVNRISALDDPCLRRLYYLRHDWDKASEIDDRLQGTFETGNLLEPVIERIVLEAGQAGNPRWRIVGAQTPTNDALLKEHQISGTIDGFLQVETAAMTGDKWIPQWQTLGVMDIKTMSPNVYARIETEADLSRYPWTAKYRGQVMLYALAHNLEWCYLLLVNKQNLYDMRLIAFPVDMAYCDGLLAKAQVVNEAIATETPPAGVNSPDVCPQCPFYSFCAPDMTTGGNLAVSANEELEAILERLEELSALVKEIGELERERDRLLPKGQDTACGRFLITWQQIEVRRKAQDARIEMQWRKKITATR